MQVMNGCNINEVSIYYSKVLCGLTSKELLKLKVHIVHFLRRHQQTSLLSTKEKAPSYAGIIDTPSMLKIMPALCGEA